MHVPYATVIEGGHQFSFGCVKASVYFVVQLVFSEAWWVGRKEDNPEEKRLPMPPELQVDVGLR